MQEVFEKLVAEFDKRINTQLKIMAGLGDEIYRYGFGKSLEAYHQGKGIIEQTAAEYNNGWIPVESGKLPENEKEVEITFTRKNYKTGETLYLTARAFYEDGTTTTEDSAYGWDETDNWEYCEEKDACIIPEGWYEGISFAEVFGIVDMPVIAWRYLTEPYQQRGE